MKALFRFAHVDPPATIELKHLQNVSESGIDPRQQNMRGFMRTYPQDDCRDLAFLLNSRRKIAAKNSTLWKNFFVYFDVFHLISALAMNGVSLSEIWNHKVDDQAGLRLMATAILCRRNIMTARRHFERDSQDAPHRKSRSFKMRNMALPPPVFLQREGVNDAIPGLEAKVADYFVMKPPEFEKLQVKLQSG
jgi:hypothetical protein